MTTERRERDIPYSIPLSKHERDLLDRLAQSRGSTGSGYMRWLLYEAAEKAGLIPTIIEKTSPDRVAA